VVERDSFAAKHEEGLCLFIEPQARSRFRESLGSAKRREKLIASLDHFKHLDHRWKIDATHMSPESVAARLRAAGAPKQCYVLSSNSDYLHADASEGWRFILGTSVDLRQALDDLVYDQFGAFVSCVPGQLAYFSGEMPDQRFILQRPGAR
jgi:hypothetical protein